LVLIFAYIYHLSGAPGLLGGFVAGIILVIAYTTLAAPIWMKYYYRRREKNSS